MNIQEELRALPVGKGFGTGFGSEGTHFGLAVESPFKIVFLRIRILGKTLIQFTQPPQFPTTAADLARFEDDEDEDMYDPLDPSGEHFH